MKGDAHDAKKQQEMNEALTKRIDELERQSAEARSTSQSGFGERAASSNESSKTKSETTPGACWGCGDYSHRLWQCPKLSNDKKKKFDRRKLRPIADHHNATCVTVRYTSESLFRRLLIPVATLPSPVRIWRKSMNGRFVLLN